MQVKIYFDGLSNSPAVEDYVSAKLAKLDRFVNPSSSVYVHLIETNGTNTTKLAIHSNSHDYAFSAEGDNLYLSFSSALDKAARFLGEEKRKMKDKIHRKYTSVNESSSEAYY